MSLKYNRHGTSRACAILMWFGDKVMLTQRKKTKTFEGYWAAVGGSVEDTDETLRHAAQREISEETTFFSMREELEIIDSYQENDFKCFIFEAHYADYLFKNIKNAEPDKHTAWQLFTLEEASKLPKLMPILKEIFERRLTKKQIVGRKKL